MCIIAKSRIILQTFVIILSFNVLKEYVYHNFVTCIYKKKMLVFIIITVQTFDKTFNR